MANITVISKPEKIDAVGKLLIEDFLRAMKKPGPTNRFNSDVFKAGDFSFKMKLFPKHPTSLDPRDSDKVILYVQNASDATVTVTKCVVEASILSKQSTEMVKLWKTNIPFAKELKKVEATAYVGATKLFSHAEYKEVCKKGDDLLVVVRLELEGKERKTSSIGTSMNSKRKRRSAEEVWTNVYKKMRDADFVLVCNGESVPCHKNILSGASSVFDAMLGNKMNKEAIEGKVNVDIPAEVGKAFVEYIYTAKLDKDLLEREAISFLEMGDKYQVPGLKELAEDEMIDQLNKGNMVQLLALSDLYRAQELREAAIKFTKLNMSWLREDQGKMDELKKLDMELVLELL